MEKIKTEKGEAALELLYVGLKDRKYQIWKRNSMSIDLINEKFFKQKLDYVHNNPCQSRWNLAEHPTEDRYSSTSYYDGLGDEFGLVTHMEEL